MEVRQEQLTASIADQTQSVKDVYNCQYLVHNVMGTDALVKSSAVEFGKVNEHVARQLYKEKKHINLNCRAPH